MLEGIPLFPEQASNLAPEVDNLYFFVTAVTAFFALLVVVFVIVFAVKYRDRTGEKVGAPITGSICARARMVDRAVLRLDGDLRLGDHRVLPPGARP